MKKLIITISLLTSSLLLAGQAKHRSGQEVQTLSAAYKGLWSPSHYPSMKTNYSVDYSQCRPVKSSHGRYRLNCTKAAFAAYRKAGGKASAFIGSVHFDARKDEHSGAWRSQSGLCEIVEIRVAIKEASLYRSDFKGLGFWTSKKGLKFVPKKYLRAQAKVALKNGESARVFTLVTQGACFGLGGNGGSLQRRFFEFKPFTSHTINHPQGKYSVFTWEAVENLRLGRSKDAKGWIQFFDRSQQLLR